VVTLVTGKHILHFGGEFLIYQNNSTAWDNLNAGTMSYTGTYTASTQGSSSTGVGYADFLLGQTQQWSANETPEYGGRLKPPQLFVQDDYKLRANLTLNLGLRYQIQAGWSEVNGNEASFDPTVQNPATATLGAMWYGVTHANGRTRIQNGVTTLSCRGLDSLIKLIPTRCCGADLASMRITGAMTHITELLRAPSWAEPLGRREV
jgi:hypothetical protein